MKKLVMSFWKRYKRTFKLGFVAVTAILLPLTFVLPILMLVLFLLDVHGPIPHMFIAWILCTIYISFCMVKVCDTGKLVNMEDDDTENKKIVIDIKLDKKSNDDSK